MTRLLSLLALAAAFGAAAWVGHRIAADPGAESPPTGAGSGAAAEIPTNGGAAAPAPAPATVGDLDGAGDAPPAKPPADAGKPIRLTFEDLVQWDLDPQRVEVPESILAYDGKRVDIVGYMIPYGNPDALTEFVIVNDFLSCCFGQAPLPHHTIVCEMAEGKTTAYVPGPVRVRGPFRVREQRQGEYLISVYAMTVEDCVEVR